MATRDVGLVVAAVGFTVGLGWVVLRKSHLSRRAATPRETEPLLPQPSQPLPRRRSWLLRCWWFQYRSLRRLRQMAFEALGDRVSQPLPSSDDARRSGVERTRGVRILVIDGGGSMGVVAATILVEIEAALSTKLEKTVFLADHFDLICGTSAGGLIALAHGSSRITLSGVRNLFATGAVFQLKFGWLSRIWSWIWEKGPYSEGPLLGLLTRAFPEGEEPRLDGGTSGREQRLRERHGDIKAKRPRIFVVSNPVNSTRLMLFTNYPSDEYTRESTLGIGFPYPMASHVRAAEAARATSAAPTYFPPAKVTVHPFETVLVDQIPSNKSFQPNARWSYFWDGGLVDNSPVQVSITQAQMLFGYSAGIDLIVSVGCGMDETREVPSPATRVSWFGGFFSSLSSALIDAMTNSEHMYQAAIRALATDPQYQDLTRGRVFRLNPKMPYERLGMEIDESDPEVLEYLSVETSRRCKDASDPLYKYVQQIVDRLIYSDSPRPGPMQEQSNQMTQVQQFEMTRAKALESLRRFPPVCISWDSSLLKAVRSLEGRATEQEKDDSRYKSPQDMNGFLRDRYTPHIDSVVSFLEVANGEIGPVNWAIQKRSDERNKLAADIEAARFGLARNVLYPLIKYGKSQNNDVLSSTFLKTFGIKTIAKMMRVLLPLEYANCFLVMSLRQGDPNSNRGLVWITSADYYLRRDQRREFWPDDRGYSINDSFLNIFQACEEEVDPDCSKLADFMRPFMKQRAPQWMKDQNPTIFADFEVGTGDWDSDFSSK